MLSRSIKGCAMYAAITRASPLRAMGVRLLHTSQYASTVTAQTATDTVTAQRVPADNAPVPQPCNDPAATVAMEEYGQYLMSVMPKFVQQYTVFKDELTLCVAPTHILPVLEFLRDHTPSQFKQLQDICGVDYPTRKYRFESVYNMLSVRHSARIRVKTYCDEVTPVPSAVPLFNSANWFERETWDMYGIYYEGHPDLRRILTDYGFEGYPLRKDFPLTGYTELRYDEEKKRVVSEPIELAQAFRNFNDPSPWEMTGEGKAAIPTLEASDDKSKSA